MPPDPQVTVGRTVHYQPDQSEEDRAIPQVEGHPLAAIVTCVWSPNCVNLAVFGADGSAHCRTSVMLGQQGGRSWSWPPRV